MPVADYEAKRRFLEFVRKRQICCSDFSKFKKSIAIGRPGFYKKHVVSKDLVRITLIISIFKEIMQQQKGEYVSSQPLVYTCTNFDIFVDIIL
jgi:hypothetical protein